MKYPIFSIRDSKVGFMSPTVDVNAPSAVRNFEHAASQASSLFSSHPADYSLYKIGDFDSDSGEISPCIPEHIVDAADFQ